VLNYFTTLGVDVAGCTAFNDRAGHGISVDSCPGNGPRGAWDQASLQRQQDKIVHAINGLDADVVDCRRSRTPPLSARHRTLPWPPWSTR